MPSKPPTKKRGGHAWRIMRGKFATTSTLLSGKKYWEQFEATPEFVVMFLPGETFFSAALEQDTGADRTWSLEPGDSRVAYNFDRSAESDQLRMESGEAGPQRATDQRSGQGTPRPPAQTCGAHYRGRSNLDRAVEAYNQAVGSLENRVLVSARKFAELGASVAEDIPELEPIETTSRALTFEWDDEPTEIPKNGRKAGRKRESVG